MLVKVFVLGRPGSGKTTAVHHLIELARRRNYFALRMKDYEILYQMFREDVEQIQFRPTDYGGFDVHDYSVFQTALQRLEEKVQQTKYRLEEESPTQNGIITIEFARSNYQEALRAFSEGFLKDAYFLFVDADLNECIRRIHRRVTNPPRPDRHYVSDYIMHSYYNVDNWDYMAYHLKQDYRLSKDSVAFRNTGSLDALITCVSNFADALFQEEFRGQIAALRE